MVVPVDSTVNATIRHSDNEPITSVAATAWVNRDDADNTERWAKPVSGPDDRIMAGIPLIARTNHRARQDFPAIAGGIAAAAARKVSE
jgi:hypothetical protein